MANKIINGGFENGEASWTFVDDTDVSTSYAYTGIRSARFITVNDTILGVPTHKSGQIEQSFALRTGNEYTLKLHVLASTLNNPAFVGVYLDKGSGEQALFENYVAEIPNIEENEWIEWDLGTHTATGESGSLRITIDTIFGGRYTYLYADQVELIEVGATTDMRDAVETDLNTISVANGYSTDVAKVYAEAIPENVRVYPCISLEPTEGGDTDPDEETERIIDAEQSFTMTAAVSGADIHTKAMNLLDDVRNALEKSTSAIMTFTQDDFTLLSVRVSDWDYEPTSEDVSNLQTQFVCIITIHYQYLRGSL